jgi:hypothetical protein
VEEEEEDEWKLTTAMKDFWVERERKKRMKESEEVSFLSV